MPTYSHWHALFFSTRFLPLPPPLSPLCCSVLLSLWLPDHSGTDWFIHQTDDCLLIIWADEPSGHLAWYCSRSSWGFKTISSWVILSYDLTNAMWHCLWVKTCVNPQQAFFTNWQYNIMRHPIYCMRQYTNCGRTHANLSGNHHGLNSSVLLRFTSVLSYLVRIGTDLLHWFRQIRQYTSFYSLARSIWAWSPLYCHFHIHHSSIPIHADLDKCRFLKDYESSTNTQGISRCESRVKSANQPIGNGLMVTFTTLEHQHEVPLVVQMVNQDSLAL